MYQPTRSCIICKIKAPKESFLAITRISGNILVLNFDQTQDGRSAYVCKSKKCVQGFIDRFGMQKMLPGLKLKLDENQIKTLSDLLHTFIV